MRLFIYKRRNDALVLCLAALSFCE